MTPCDHLKPDTYPLQLDLLIDAELTFTDALLSCRVCHQPYLLELLDRRGSDALFRLSMPDAEQCRQLLRDLNRGSCDLQRAHSELSSLQSMSPYLPYLLLLDCSEPKILQLLELPDIRLPGGSWRQLPCDGQWFDQLRV